MAITKVKISRISHFDKDKEGNQLKSAKSGKPYTRCLIDLVDGRKVSGFGNQVTKTWSAGDEVEIDITQSGEYWNFSVPKKENVSEMAIKTHIDRQFAVLREDLRNIAEHLGMEGVKPKLPPYPEEQIDVFTQEEIDSLEGQVERNKIDF